MDKVIGTKAQQEQNKQEKAQRSLNFFCDFPKLLFTKKQSENESTYQSLDFSLTFGTIQNGLFFCCI